MMKKIAAVGIVFFGIIFLVSMISGYVEDSNYQPKTATIVGDKNFSYLMYDTEMTRAIVDDNPTKTDGKVLVVEYKVTNNSLSPISFNSMTGVKAFQNGVECSETWFCKSYEATDLNADTDIQSGKSAVIRIAFDLKNDKDKVEVTFYDGILSSVQTHSQEIQI